MERSESSEKFPIGSLLPDFMLPATDGKSYGREYFKGAPASLIVFTCNHCPYVKGSEQELLQLIADFQKQGLRAVLISANDAAQYPDDSFENMKLKSEQAPLPCPYLYDRSQDVARLFDAQCTPEAYLFDGDLKLVFHGAINDSPRDASKVTKLFLEQALKQVLSKKCVEQAFAHPIGCSIKWTN